MVLCCTLYIILLFHVPDVMAGHDLRDSTTVTDPFSPFTLPEDISVSGLHIGIPKVTLFIIFTVMKFI